jgi:hypothetical protein
LLDGAKLAGDANAHAIDNQSSLRVLQKRVSKTIFCIAPSPYSYS